MKAFTMPVRTLGTLGLAAAFVLAAGCAEQDTLDTANDEVAAAPAAAAKQVDGDKHHHRKDPAKSAAFLKDKLDLTADQATELEAALGQVESHEDKRSALDAILTPEQMARFDEMHKAKKRWHHKGHKAMHKDPAAHAAKIQEVLGLTDEVTAQVEAALRDNESHEDVKAALANILTADQLAELKAQHKDMRKAHKGMHKRMHKDTAAHAAKLQSLLDLTDEQTAQVEAAFRDSDSHEAKKAALESILTAEQMQQLRELKGKKHGQHGPH